MNLNTTHNANMFYTNKGIINSFYQNSKKNTTDIFRMMSVSTSLETRTVDPPVLAREFMVYW